MKTPIRNRLVAILAFTAVLIAASARAQISGGSQTTFSAATFVSPTLTGNVTAGSALFQAATPICFDGATAGTFKTCFSFTDPAGSDKTVTFVNASGTAFLSTLATNAPDVANSVWGVSNGLTFEGATANGFETTLTPTDPTSARTITLPDGSGTVGLVGETSNTWVDTGDGANATFTWDPLPGQTIFVGTCNDTQGCDLVVTEVAAQPGMRFTVFEAASGAGGHILVKNNAGVINTKAGSDLSLAAIGGAVDFCYIASTWVQCSPLL